MREAPTENVQGTEGYNLGHDFGQVAVHTGLSQRLQTKVTVSDLADLYEQEADRVAEQVTQASHSPFFAGRPSTLLSRSEPLVQRLVMNEAGMGTETSAPQERIAPEGTAPGLIVEDEARDLAPGQMRKSEFLDQLRTSACAVADEELARAGRSTEGCPYIERAFARYRTRSSQYLERAMRRYAPEAAGVTTAREYIPLVSERIRQGVATWATTGEVTGVPPELAAEIGGGGVLGAIGGFFSGVASAVSGVVSSIGGLFAKARDGGMRDADPQEIRSQLRSGQALASGVKSRMESAFGHDFSRVRVHTDSNAAALSGGLNARAFTIGSDIAFGSGEYKPGTLVGDALLAHELAHVVQQGGASASAEPTPKGQVESSTLEEEADRLATGSVVPLWSQFKGKWRGASRQVTSHLRSGLRLQRCGASRPQQRATTVAQCAPIDAAQWTAGVQAARAMSDINQRGAAMTRLAEQALCSLGIQVHAAGDTHPTTVHPDDYQPTPALNFDVRLNDKTRWRGPNEVGPPVGNNPGYNFSLGRSRSYAIIGPNALNENTPLTTRQYAQHELYMTSHATERPAGERSADFELATWTEDFRNYFHQYLALPLPQRPQWAPLIQYYEQASGPARQAAVDRLVDYYRNPPVSGDERERCQRSFARWLRQRSGTLINDLNAVLHLPTTTTP